MDIVICVVVLFFTVLNLVLYHKFFDVYYFSLGHGLAKEIGASVLIAIVEAALLMYIGGYVLAILGIIIVIALIVKAIKKFTGGSEGTDAVQASAMSTNKTMEAKVNEFKETISSNVQKVEKAIKTDTAVATNNIEKKVRNDNAQNVPEDMYCPHCGKKISRSAKFCNFCGKANSYNK